MRNKKRIPVVMRIFKYNSIAFYNFLAIGDDLIAIKYRSRFIDAFEDIFYEWMEEPDQRFGQLLINMGVIPDLLGVWDIEESDWLVKNKYVQPEDIYTWGTFGIEGEDKMLKWASEKPKFNAPLDSIELMVYPEAKKWKNYELYAWRWRNWADRKPKPEYRFIKNLDTGHIENILAIKNIGHKDVFEKVLKQRQDDSTKKQ